MRRLSRRDFLKLGSIISGGVALSRFAPKQALTQPSASVPGPNILIFVFDAMSAKNLSLYGYHRRTTPNLERFAQRATVYNQHYSAGNFTTPGTASLLTGLYPWTHRAINTGGPIARAVADHNLFRALGSSYYRLAFSQNFWPNYYFGQFLPEIEKILSPASFSVIDQIISVKFGADLVDSHRAFGDLLFQDGPASLVFGVFDKMLLYEAVARASAPDYPGGSNGIPHTENYPIYFQLKDVFDGVRATLESLMPPSLAYIHFWSPHAPYMPTIKFDSLFEDGWAPKPKPVHALAGSDFRSVRHMNYQRQKYDEYVANLDDEFGRLLDALDARGILDQSYVVITSDHGEFFERGVERHLTPLMYDPVVRVPLLIRAPGQRSRQDVYLPTDSVDVLPTLVHLSGAEPPDWCEGKILPAFGGVEDPERNIFMMDAKYNRAFLPLTRASFGMRKGAHKLVYYMGFKQYQKKDKFELYDLDRDPEELSDLYSESSPLARSLRDELLAKVREVSGKPAS